MSLWVSFVGVVLGVLAGAVPGYAQAPAGAAVFEKHCASCHKGTASTDAAHGAPSIDALKKRTPDAIVNELSGGLMSMQGNRMTTEERVAVAEYITGRKPAGGDPMPAAAKCAAPPAAFTKPLDGPAWSGWGRAATNTRFQPATQAGITAAQVPNLKLKWAFGFPNATAAHAQPAVAGGRVFVGSQNGHVYSLDAKSGCVIWDFRADAAVRTAVSIGQRPGTAGAFNVYFGDISKKAYALDAVTGKQLWKTEVETHPLARVTGAPTVHEGLLFVPVSGLGEEVSGGLQGYQCCTFRGSVLALDVRTGAVRWKSYTLDEEAKPNGKMERGAPLWGPSGGSVWTSPTIDAKRGVIYVTTGNQFTGPNNVGSNAVIAMEMSTGKVRWVSQRTPDDIAKCGAPPCNAPDVDFAASAILVTLAGGRDLVIAPQKNGIVWALDPDREGALVWQYNASPGGPAGGIEFGGAADADQAYVAISDLVTRPATGTQGGMHAVKLATGERAWATPAPKPLCGAEQGMGCTAAQIAAVTAIPGVVFSGSNDGGFRAYSTKDGSIIWTFDTNRDFETVNKVPGKGGSMSGPGPIVAGGMIYVNSGYGVLYGRPGNVLLAFGVD